MCRLLGDAVAPFPVIGCSRGDMEDLGRELQPLLLRVGRQQVRDFGNDVPEIEIDRVERDATRLDPRQVENVVEAENS